MITGDQHPGGNGVLNQMLAIFQVEQAGVAARTGFATGRVPGQRDILMRVNVVGQRTQRRGMALLAPGFLVPLAS